MGSLGFLSCGDGGLLSGCGGRASHCSGFSRCRAQALGLEGFSCCVLGAPEHEWLWHMGLVVPRHVESS